MKKFGFYIIKDEYFTRFDDPYLKGNKKENRPHYYCFEDETNGLYWLIPMSSRTEKYKSIILKKQEQHKPCDILHICKLGNDREAVFFDTGYAACYGQIHTSSLYFCRRAFDADKRRG